MSVTAARTGPGSSVSCGAAWRERELAPLAPALAFPLWEADPAELLLDLERSGVPCIISACPGRDDAPPGPPPIEVGATFDRALIERVLAAGWDPFGEAGEFHTRAEIWRAPRRALD